MIAQELEAKGLPPKLQRTIMKAAAPLRCLRDDTNARIAQEQKLLSVTVEGNGVLKCVVGLDEDEAVVLAPGLFPELLRMMTPQQGRIPPTRTSCWGSTTWKLHIIERSDGTKRRADSRGARGRRGGVEVTG